MTSFLFCEVQVFSATAPFDLETELRISGLQQPRAIVACEETKHLYISDSTLLCIFKVTPDGKLVQKIALFSYPSHHPPLDPWSLSLLLPTRLLFTGGGEIHFVEISNKPKLPELIFPFHTVETSHGTFVLSHSIDYNHFYGGSCRFTISEINQDGHVIHTMSINSAACGLNHADDSVFFTTDRTGEAGHIVPDGYGRFLVAGGSHVLLLSGQLELERVLLMLEPTTEIPVSQCRAYRLCYVKQTGLLAVAHYNDHIRIFKVR